MRSLKKYVFALLAILFIKTVKVKSEKDIKSSLAFVIDNTGSMWNDIAQVKMGVNDIFDAVLNSNDSQIENYVIVTFNDPEVKTRAITKDREYFRNALNEISVDGGGDCEEYCMSGIERALEISLPGSYLYVCTDATAKDYERYKYVKALAQKKGSQVVFLLTGDCGGPETSPDYKVYYDLAKATNGQVFHLGKTDIHDILDYVIINVKGRRTPLATADFPPGEHKLNFTADHKTTDIVIAAAGKKPVIGITDPDGEKGSLDKVLEKENVGIYSKNITKPGVHTVTIESISKTSVVVTGKTKLNFKHGFSTFVPTSVDDAATRPPLGLKTHLSIQLVEADGVELKMIKFKDIDGHDIGEEIPFTVVDEKRKFYLTDLIDAPKDMFKISIMCHDSDSDTYLIRVTPTMIEASTVLDPPKPKSPIASIEGEPKIVAEFGAPLKLKCKIHAYPKPSVLWQVKETGVSINSTVSTKELPYEYISIAEIETVNKNETYLCSVVNEHGKVDKEVAIETINKYYFNVVKKPKDTIIEYAKNGEINCKVDAFPAVNVMWFKDGVEVINALSDENMELTEYNSTLKIKNMQPDLVGNYICEARNKMKRELFYFKVGISGIEPPKVNKTVNRIYVLKGSKVDLNCSVIAGKPKPTISWKFVNKLRNVKYFYRDVISIKNVGLNNAGIYRCVANNLKGIDFHATELVVEYPATIKDSIANVTAREGEKVLLTCHVDGVPKPSVRWFEDGAIITSSRTVHIYRDHSLRLKASLESAGNYTCTAENKYAAVNETTTVYVNVPVSIEPPKESVYKVIVGSSLILPCSADGYPKPTIQWIFYNKLSKSLKTLKSKDFSLRLRRLQLKDEGYYICSARNAAGSSNITYDVRVLAPPVIENIYPDKTFVAVQGDLTLRITCKATGNPKPSIIWLKNKLPIASGSEWYDIENDGTLVIKNVDYLSNGLFVCDARNDLGSDQEVYTVIVEPYPRSGPPTNTITVEEGQSALLKCEVPHKFLDTLRWYKDDRIIATGEYELKNATLADSGIYTCRVSDFSKSRTGNTKVDVIIKPQFLSDVDEEVSFELEGETGLDCEVKAEPPAKVRWFYNEKPLNDTLMHKQLIMNYNNIGVYTCEVSNDFGTITRKFKIISPECILDVSKDFNGRQPLMYSSKRAEKGVSLNWVNFYTFDGYMLIPNNNYITLVCPNNFQNFPKSATFAFCQSDTNKFRVPIEGNFTYSDLKCNDDMQILTELTGNSCDSGRGELVKVGYSVFDNFLEAYGVCFDKHSSMPIYTKHSMKTNIAGVAPKDVTWHNSDLVPLDFETLYDCNYELDYRSLDRWSDHEDECCFSKRKLVSPKDMVPGLAQIATYSSINVVPHWSSCSTQNWEELESRVRELATSISYDLTVYTGVSNTLPIQTYGNKTWNAHMTDVSSRKQVVPQYLWKVIQDPATRSSLAVIQVNVPGLPQSDASKYVICRDLCNTIPWMLNPNWNDVTKGGFCVCRHLSHNNTIETIQFTFKTNAHDDLKVMAMTLDKSVHTPQFAVRMHPQVTIDPYNQLPAIIQHLQ